MGRVGGLPGRYRVVISLRTRRGRRSPLFLLSTDTVLPLSQVVQLYMGRWLIERLHWDLKVKLGLGDVRARSLRGICRYAAVCLLARGFLEWRAWAKTGASADSMIAPLRRARAERILRQTLRQARRGVKTQTILEQRARQLCA